MIAPGARQHGRALVIVKGADRRSDQSFQATVVLVDGFIHATEVRARRGACGEFWFAPATDRAWNEREVREIRWLDQGVSS